jgi:glycosyltransferase involved in cell wall biosynthesis
MARVTLSVALATFNGKDYLPEQLRSLAAQSRQPDELVICDDHSIDETLAIIRAFTPNAPFPVRLYVNEHNLGSTKSFEKAFQYCQCDIIALAIKTTHGTSTN